MTKSALYTDDYLQASEYLRLVLPLLSKHKIPASPLNYQTAYEFAAASNAALKQALEEHLDQTGELSEKTLMELHKRHVAQDDSALESVRQELKKIIINIQNEYDNSNENLSDYLDSLNSFSSILSGNEDWSSLAAETQKVMENTLSAEQSQRNFESQISGMMQEMDTLREQLEQVREESLTDALTGLANRKAFDQMLDSVVQNNTDEQSPFCLVIADIDHFKNFNDTYGHLVGDKVLRYVGKTITSCIKGKDMAARFGGEEFILILPDTEITGAEIVADQVRQAISKSNLIDHRNNEEYGKITISLGIAQFKQGEQPEELLNRADQALYQAKDNGRNRVEMAI